MRCVLLDDYQDVATTYADWSRLAGVDVTTVTHHARPDELVELLRGVEVVVAMRERTPFGPGLLERLPDLRLLVTTGLRNAAIDLEAARRLGITVCGTRGGNDSTSELTWALLLGVARHLRSETIDRGRQRWQSSVGKDLRGATLGLVGLGRIGRQVATVAQAFGMDVVAWSPHLDDARASEAGVRRAPTLVDLMRASDFVSIHLVLSESTRGIVDRDAIAAMRSTAYLVNTARAGLVDMAALTEALAAGRIAGAGLDVYDAEPLPLDHPLRTLPTVLGTPHLGYVTESNYRRFFADAVDDIQAWRDGAPVRVLG